MAEKKKAGEKQNKGGRPKKYGELTKRGRTGESLRIDCDPQLMDALRRWMNDQVAVPAKTEAVQGAIRFFLTHEGYWPPNESTE
jgi:hypothetical protein